MDKSILEDMNLEKTARIEELDWETLKKIAEKVAGI